MTRFNGGQLLCRLPAFRKSMLDRGAPLLQVPGKPVKGLAIDNAFAG
jgi:hypothetical protein